jgi:glycosyltransferase involved in cell wall biosynthesis
MRTVSIITPLFNKGSYVEETVRSVQAQTFGDWEMIVVDNGSTDGGPALVHRFAAEDPRVRLVSSPKRGPGAARNFGLSQAGSEWVLFLDADDSLEPEYLVAQMAAAELQSKANIVVGCWLEFTDAAPHQREHKRPAGMGKSLQFLRDYAVAFAPWAVHAAIVRRDILAPTTFWPEELDRFLGEDIHFWFRLITDHQVAFSGSQGALYRTQTKNCRNENHNAGKWYGGIDAVINANLAWLRARNQAPTAGQLENLFRVYAGLYRQAFLEPSPVVAARARERARFWLRERMRAAGRVPLALIVAKLAGLRLFTTLQHLRLAQRRMLRSTP